MKELNKQIDCVNQVLKKMPAEERTNFLNAYKAEAQHQQSNTKNPVDRGLER